MCCSMFSVRFISLYSSKDWALNPFISYFSSWQVGFFKTPSAWPSSDLNNFLATFLMRNECGLDCSNGCFDIQHRLILPNSQIGLDLRNQPCNGSRSFPGSRSPRGWPHETWKF